MQRWSRGIALLFFLIWVLDGVCGQRHPPATLLPGKTWYPFDRRLGWHQGVSGRARKISPTTEIRSPDRPACSESLYRLSYHSQLEMNIKNNLISACNTFLCYWARYSELRCLHVVGFLCIRSVQGAPARTAVGSQKTSCTTAWFSQSLYYSGINIFSSFILCTYRSQ
jgi:hypothetical protein